MTDTDQDRIDAAIAKHNETVDEALNGLAADSDIPPLAYVEALQDIAHRCQMAAHAVLLEQEVEREWALFVVEVDRFLSNYDGSVGQNSRAIDLHRKVAKWKGAKLTKEQTAILGKVTDRLLYEVFKFDPAAKKEEAPAT